MPASYEPKLCQMSKFIPFLMDDSKRWKAYFYKKGKPSCVYTLFAESDDIPQGTSLTPEYSGMGGGNWAYYTVSQTCDRGRPESDTIITCAGTTRLNQGEQITLNSQSSRLSIVGSNGKSASKFSVRDIGLGGIQEWSLPKYVEPGKEKWGSVLGHQKIYPELSPPYIRGPRLGIRTAHAYIGDCPPCEDMCCICKMSCDDENQKPPISNIDGEKIKKAPCDVPCNDPYTIGLGKPLGFEDTCYCVSTTPVYNSDYVKFLNYVAKNDIFGGNNMGYTAITNDRSILDLWNIDMHPIIIREIHNDNIHKYSYSCDDSVANLPVVNVTFYAAIWYIKWMRSGFLDIFRYSESEIANDPSKKNCIECIQELIQTDYTWLYNQQLIL